MKPLVPLMVAAAVSGILATTNIQPAQADQAAVTRNTIIGAAALIAGIAIETNVAHKRQLANSVQGYLPDGSTVYRDGHVVTPNGQSYYPSQYGETVACNGTYCYLSGGQNYGYNPNNGYPPNNYYPSQQYGPYNQAGNTGNGCNGNYNQGNYNNGYQNGYNTVYYQTNGQRRHRGWYRTHANN